MFPSVTAETLINALDSHASSARKAAACYVLRLASQDSKTAKDTVAIFRASTFSRAFRDAGCAARLAGHVAAVKSSGKIALLNAAMVTLTDDPTYASEIDCARIISEAGLTPPAANPRASGRNAPPTL